MHRLTAGAGYQYLLRHTASGDCDRAASSSLTAYYVESGNPPGRWMGSGVASLGTSTDLGPGTDAVGIVVGDRVEEEAMARLYGSGTHPVTGGALGRPYVQSEPVSKRVATQVEKLSAGMSEAAHAAAVEAITRVEFARHTRTSVSGFDLTFTPPKSVSILWGVGDARTRAAIGAAHAAAVEQALAFVDERAIFTRTGQQGCRQERTRGVIAVGFDHWDSRAGDPNLHTHVVVANKVRGADGGWRSVDSRALHHAIVAASEVYDALLADEVARRLPVRWGWRHRGARRNPRLEIDGVDDALLGEFSTRSTQIDQAMSEVIATFAASHGRSPSRVEITRLRQQVTRSTRPGKMVRSLPDLVPAWRARAEVVSGRTPEDMVAATMRTSHATPLRADAMSVPVIDRVADTVLGNVMTRRSTWTRWNVLAETARVTRGFVMISPTDRHALHDRIADTVLQRCMSTSAPALFTATGRYLRADGTTVFDRPDEQRFTSQVILDAEMRLLAKAIDTTGPTTTPAALSLAAGSTDHPLAADQLDVVTAIGSSGKRLDVLVGPAGAGKTTTLRGMRAAWEHTHGRGTVVGLAPSAAAAGELSTALGIVSENTAKWMHETSGPAGRRRVSVLTRLHEARTAPGVVRNLTKMRTIDTAILGQHREQARWQLRAGQLLIVDEASLAGTVTLDALTTQASTAGAKVLLVGDYAQLSAIDAGGAFALLADRTGPAHLTSLWRFHQPWEAAATLGLRDGDVRVLEDYADHERIHAGPAEAMLEDAYAAWALDVDAGVDAIMVAPDARSVAALNARAHRDRVADALVQPGGVTTSEEQTIGVGDRIVTRRNDRRLRTATIGTRSHVRNGDLWTVTAIYPDRSVTADRTTGPGGTVQLPAWYVAHDVELGYATTTHRAQGMTVDRAHVLAHPTMSRESLYVAMTRGRDANHVYVALDAIDPDCDQIPESHTQAAGQEVLAAILAAPGAELSATATIAAEQDRAGSLQTLHPIRATLLADASHTRWTTTLTRLGMADDDVRTIATSQAAGQLFTALDRVATLAGSSDQAMRGLLAGTAETGTDPALELKTRALAWLHRLVPDWQDAPLERSPDGLDQNGRALLDQVEDLIAQREAALSYPGPEKDPAWVAQLGPEPTDNLTTDSPWDDAATSGAREPAWANSPHTAPAYDDAPHPTF